MWCRRGSWFGLRCGVENIKIVMGRWGKNSKMVVGNFVVFLKQGNIFLRMLVG